MMEDNNRHLGLKAETWFMNLLQINGLKHEYLDDWYDFDVEGQKVEVKSCRVCVKQKNKAWGSGFMSGRFDLGTSEVRDRQYDANVWVALIVREAGQFILLGMVRARKFNKRRYAVLTTFRQYSPVLFGEWVVKARNGGYE